MKNLKKINIKNKYRLLTVLSLILILVTVNIAYFITYGDRILEFTDDPDYISSQVLGNKVYVNDLEADYDYYMGLNYTDNSGTYPSETNKNIYNDTNLIQVKITYSSQDNAGNIGYVSLTERQDTYIYFKTYYINNNETPNDYNDDFIDIELIDNPYTDRPSNLGFNGWITDYNGVILSYDSEYYERHAKVPVAYTDNKPNKIDITFTASWVEATTANVSNNFDSAIAKLNEISMQKITSTIIVYADVDMSGYYYQVNLTFGQSYAGLYNNRGRYQRSGICYSFGGCTYYELIENEMFDEANQYYELVNGYMTLVDNSTIERPIISSEPTTYYNNANMASFYQKVNIPQNSTYAGYYNELGEYQTSGTCNTNGGCTYYELIQYYDSNGNPQTYNADNEYYYLVTRDTNILIMINNMSGSWSNNGSYPFTLTSSYNGETHDVTWNANYAVNCYNDINIENIKVYYETNASIYNPPTGTNAAGVLFGRYNNIKIGRGLTQNGTYVNFISIVAGNGGSTGRNNKPNKYKVMIESGIYSSISLSTGATNSSRTYTLYLKNKTIYGNDYDRVKKDNNKLDIYYCASGSWSSNIYGSTNSTTSNSIIYDLTVKSGTYGSSKHDLSTGIYVGGRYAGRQYAVRQVKVEGGYIYNLIGGPLSATNRTNLNDIYIYMTGGEIDMITGGAGTTATYGNRIIQITGGTINYSVFAGSNGYDGDEWDGTLNGSGYVYIGGNATIGKTEYVENNEKLYGAEAGSIFGIGNGKEGYSTIGSCDNSTIIIDGNATINRNVYGGGNFGATGVSSTSTSSTSKIVINDGLIKGSVYGGGNNNGSGSDTVNSTIDIKMYNGFVVGSIYGGSNEEGTIYGTVTINVWGGEITNSVYGGGQGGITSTKNGTYVRDNITVTIGNIDYDNTPIINGQVYGGSAYGTVGGTTNSENVSTSDTLVTVNKGIISNVYGGGQGNSEYTPYVLGDIKVVVNNGIITNVFGGNDKSGTPNGNIEVYINGGTITNTYGGGNETSAKETNVYLTGGTSSKIFGGSNLSGNVTISHVTTTGGNAEVVYGGNNQGGTTGTTNVLINGGTIGVVYGGGEKTSVTESTNVTIKSEITDAFGGSNLEGNIPTSNIIIENAITQNVYGGNNQGGLTQISNVNIYGGSSQNIYGGGLKAKTTTTNINAYYGNIENIYGGGSEAGATTTNVSLGIANIKNIYGGSNLSGTVENSYIKNLDNQTLSNIDLSVNYGTSDQHNEQDTSYISSQKITVSITNNTGTNINTWDLYLMTSEGFIGANWSSATIEELGNGYHINEINQYYGTNTISSGNSFTFDYHIHSQVEYEDFKIYGCSFIGYDSNGNKYVTSCDKNLKASNVYGGNNQGGQTNIANINLTRGIVDYLYGGGKQAQTQDAIINITNTKVNKNIYGGGDEASINTVDLTISSSIIGNENDLGNIFGGGNQAPVDSTIRMNIKDNTTIYGSVYGGGNQGDVLGLIESIIESSEITENVYGGGNQAPVGQSGNTNIALSLTLSNTQANNVFGGGNAASINGNTILNINNQSIITNSVYGGGNLGEIIGKPTTTISDSTITENVYGAGNKASVGISETIDATELNIDNVTAKNIYGGGNAAPTNGDANTIISSSTISESIFGGGNGTESIVENDTSGEQNLAKVLGNVNITINNNTTVKNIYGGGNLGMVNGNTNINATAITATNSIYGGGNAAIVGKNTYLLVSNCIVQNSVYAGGNGTTAIVKGNTNLDIDNGSNITNHVFGGGNAAATGIKEVDNSTGIVNIAGAIIGKNVYGGANTSVLYGVTTVNIGQNVITNNSLIPTDISIGGTVFGGGEANASGSENYDFTFISVTKGININIDAKNHNIFTINGSIFGSGNASSTEGYSYVNISNYGTPTDIKRNVSIQRASIVTINNSYISLSGATDRTNEYSDVLFTLSRIDELKIKNSSSLYLETGANLVKKFNSVVDIDGVETKASATIDNEAETFTRNTNNRIYMLEGQNLNIAKNENITDYGDVSGMTFFGMYSLDRNKNIITALYNDYSYGETVSPGDIYYFTNGSYVLGKHLTNHDITVDGFYSNYGSEEGNNIIIKYIEPTPDDTNFYMWSIGEVVASYTVNLTASKYSTLGAQEVPLLNHTSPNTTFTILGVNYSGLDTNITLIDYNEIPRVAATEEEANTVFGLNMKTGQVGWLNNGNTSFITNEDTQIIGTKDYNRENYNNVPALVFYLYHSKNLTTTGSIGSVTVSMVAITPIDDLNNHVERINININLSKALYNTNDYEGTINPGKKYEMFATSTVDITTKSSFSTYYSLYIESETNPYRDGYYRSLVSTFAFPINTKITMIDFHDGDTPIYYYYVINQEDYEESLIEFNAYGETSYKLSKFVKMGSTSQNNNYSDDYNNNNYYQNNIAEEEFIFMVDFKDANITDDILNKSLLIELRNSDDQTLISVLGIEQQTLKYNLYTNSEANIELEGSVSKNPVYLGNSTNLTIDTNFVQNIISSNTIYDTTYDNEKLGIKLSIYDSRGNILSAQDLMGVNFTYNGNTYYPRYDGTTRIKISEKVANARSKITFNTGTSKLSTDEYTILIESFGSYDGIYYGPESSKQLEIKLNIIDTPYGLSISVIDELMFIDKTTGFTLNDNNSYVFKIGYVSELNNPSLRIKLQRRNYDSIYNNIYNDVNLLDYITNEYNQTSNNYEYILSTNPVNEANYILKFKENLITGTYRIVISLYDGDNYIGDVYQYLIIR